MRFWAGNIFYMVNFYLIWLFWLRKAYATLHNELEKFPFFLIVIKDIVHFFIESKQSESYLKQFIWHSRWQLPFYFPSFVSFPSFAFPTIMCLQNFEVFSLLFLIQSRVRRKSDLIAFCRIWARNICRSFGKMEITDIDRAPYRGSLERRNTIICLLYC